MHQRPAEILISKPETISNMEAVHEVNPVCARRCRGDNCAQHHFNSSPELSVVRPLQRWRGWRRYKLRFHNISTMHGHRARAGQLLPTQHTVSASSGTTPIN